ncbi:hypothetical protein ABW20_dc0101029 [Dactylellina cionopaga]|nr:hypothetical protein ABW20_dc0101029 [Dactylellina cionopaga]
MLYYHEDYHIVPAATTTIRTFTTTSTSISTQTSTKFTQTTITTTVPTRSTTVVSITTVTKYLPFPTDPGTCGNAGLSVGIYDDPFSGDEGADYPTYVPEYYKTITPYDTRTAINYLGIQNSGDQQSPHGFTPRTPSSYTLNYRGYFYASKSSTYTFKLRNGDNWVGFWLGNKAVRDWTRANADGTSIWNPSSSISTSSEFQITLAAGSYTPLRLIIGSFAGAVTYTFEVFDADGINYVQYGTSSPNLVSFACNGVVPPFPPFGQETKLPDTTCNNAGASVGIYDDPYVADDSPDYASFVPEFFKTVTPFDSTRTQSMGIVNQGDADAPHGFQPHAHGDYVLNYRAYFYSPISTTYTIKVYHADNWAGFWTTNAVTGWTRANADGTSIWDPTTFISSQSQIQVAIPAETYYPIRFVIGSFAGFVSYNFEIVDEAAGLYYVKYGTPSPYLVSAVCDNSVAAFPPFGAEV